MNEFLERDVGRILLRVFLHHRTYLILLLLQQLRLLIVHVREHVRQRWLHRLGRIVQRLDGLCSVRAREEGSR